MGARRRFLLGGSALATLSLFSAPVGALETVTYSYDTLGRLVVSSISGGPSNSIGTVTCFDPAGNRTLYSSGVGASSSCPAGTPTPSPAPTPAPAPTPTPTPTPPPGGGECPDGSRTNSIVPPPAQQGDQTKSPIDTNLRPVC